MACGKVCCPEPEFLQVDEEWLTGLPRVVLFDELGRDEAMVRSATMWSPMLLSQGKALGLVFKDRCLWVPVHVRSNWIYVETIELVPVVSWAANPYQYQLVTKAPKRSVIVDLDYTEILRN